MKKGPKPKVRDKLWLMSRVTKVLRVFELGDCWEWSNCLTSTGYGNIGTGKTWVSAHRFSWELYNGFIPDGLWVLHKCDNRCCVNPAHLFLGTVVVNNKDKCDKGRASGGSMPGKTNPSAKLNERIVMEIRHRRKDGCTRKELSIEFDVPFSTVKKIVTNRTWKHIPM